MKNGIYSVVFKSSIGIFGGGLVVIEEGRIHGGNVKYIFKGFIREQENSVEAEIKVEHYQGPLDSIFGEIENYSLLLSATPEPESFRMKGYMVENTDMKVEVEGIKVSDLVN